MVNRKWDKSQCFVPRYILGSFSTIHQQTLLAIHQDISLITYYCHNLNFYLTEASVHRFYSLNLMSDDIKTLFVCNVMVLIFMKATELGTCYIFLRKHKKSQYKLKVFSKHIGILCAKFPLYSYQICNWNKFDFASCVSMIRWVRVCCFYSFAQVSKLIINAQIGSRRRHSFDNIRRRKKMRRRRTQIVVTR